MSKDKRKKKYFQGMEHLQHEVVQTANAATPQTVSAAGLSAEAGFIRRDLRNVIVLMVIIVLLLSGLAILDRRTDVLTQFAERVSSVVIE